MNDGLGWASARKSWLVLPLVVAAMLLLPLTDLAMLLPPLIVGTLLARVSLGSRNGASG